MSLMTTREELDEKVETQLGVAVRKLVVGLTDEHLGKCIREYLEESCHQGWDGFPIVEQYAAIRLFEDIRVYIDNRGEVS